MPMGIELHSVKGISCGWRVAAKPCDTCKAAAAAVFCRVDSAFLCLNCDLRIHNCMNKHARVWMCEVCEQAPAAVTCKADAAALCVTCDNDIHSANPLARRHERLPIEPFFDSADSIVKSSAFNFLVPSDQNGGSEFTGASEHDGVDSASWLTPNSKLGIENAGEMKSGDLFFIDPFIDLNDFDYPNSFQNHHSPGMDSVVPVQTTKPEPIPAPAAAPLPLINNENCFDIDFCRSKLSSFNYQSQSVSSSSLDVGVVPDGNSMSENSYPFGRNMSTGSGADPNITVSAPGANQASQLCGIDREARVLRYREKRKNRKFEKTIRYHSRKAYAETRPRIKGRFAKRTDADSEVDRLYNSAASAAGAYLADSQYGVVPSFW